MFVRSVFMIMLMCGCFESNMSWFWHSVRVDSMFPFCLMIHTVTIHTAARLTCYLSPRSSRSAWSNLVSDILTFWTLLCGHILKQANNSTVSKCSWVCLRAIGRIRTPECMLWLSQTGAEISCVHHGSRIGKQMKLNSGPLCPRRKLLLSRWNKLNAQKKTG